VQPQHPHSQPLALAQWQPSPVGGERLSGGGSPRSSLTPEHPMPEHFNDAVDFDEEDVVWRSIGTAGGGGFDRGDASPRYRSAGGGSFDDAEMEDEDLSRHELWMRQMPPLVTRQRAFNGTSLDPFA